MSSGRRNPARIGVDGFADGIESVAADDSFSEIGDHIGRVVIQFEPEAEALHPRA